jgi:hypothetical protein
MKKTALFLILSCLIISLNGQDLIVTRSGDSLNCRITRSTPANIYFTFKYMGEVRNTMLPATEILVSQKNYYARPDVPPGKVVGKNIYKAFSAGVTLGPGYRFGKIDPDQSQSAIDYLKGLKWGFQAGANITYFISEPMGIGFSWSRFMSANSAENVMIMDQGGNLVSADISDDIDISYYAPTFTTRMINASRKGTLYLNYSAGLLTYRDNTIITGAYKITGSTIGFGIDIGYNIDLSENLQAVFQLSMITGYISTIKIDDGSSVQTVDLEKGSYETLSRIDFSVGLRFNK